MKIHMLLPVIAISLLAGCQKEDQLIEISLVDPALQPYFRAFEEEASARGITLDASFSEIEATIREINEGNVIGQCWYSSHYPNEIRIDKKYWQNASYLGREMVVFHELGHCSLDRGHTEGSTASGICLSIMASGTGSCRNLYNRETRAYYLDELFFGGSEDELQFAWVH